jgi:hypothetical protein
MAQASFGQFFSENKENPLFFFLFSHLFRNFADDKKDVGAPTPTIIIQQEYIIK